MRVKNCDQKVERRKDGSIGRRPSIAGLALAASLALAPMQARSETAHTCSAQEVEGTMESFQTSGSKRGRMTGLKLNVPLLEENRYMSISVPDPYVDDLVREAAKLPAAKRSPFVRSALQRTVDNAVDAMRPSSGKRLILASFECGPFSEPSKAAAPAKSAGPKLNPPIAPLFKGGDGTKEQPFTMEVPVPYGPDKGAKIGQSDFSITTVGQDGSASAKSHFRITYVSADRQDGYVASLEDLGSRLGGSFAAKSKVSRSSLIARSTGMVKAAAKSFPETVGRYLGVQPEAQMAKRRRTIHP